MTRAQWIAKADAICTRTNAQVATYPVKTTSDFARALPPAAVYEHEEAIALMRLVPPPSKAKDWKAVVTATMQVAVNSAELGREAVAGTFTIDSPLVAATTRANAIMGRITLRDGFTSCAEL
ncbi:MAG: hypothetical protein WA484_13285 [Solirubrobacteraceae bacterium]